MGHISIFLGVTMVLSLLKALHKLLIWIFTDSLLIYEKYYYQCTCMPSVNFKHSMVSQHLHGKITLSPNHPPPTQLADLIPHEPQFCNIYYTCGN